MQKHVDICWPMYHAETLHLSGHQEKALSWPSKTLMQRHTRQGLDLVAFGGYSGGYSDLQCSSSRGGKDGLGSEELGTPCLSSRTPGVYAKRLPHAGCQRPTALHPTCCPKQSWSFRNPNCSFSILYNMIAHLSSGTRPTRTTGWFLFSDLPDLLADGLAEFSTGDADTCNWDWKELPHPWRWLLKSRSLKFHWNSRDIFFLHRLHRMFQSA